MFYTFQEYGQTGMCRKKSRIRDRLKMFPEWGIFLASGNEDSKTAVFKYFFICKKFGINSL